MWKALREITKGISFYYKQMNLFLLLVLIVVAVFISATYVPRFVSLSHLSLGIDASSLFPQSPTSGTAIPTHYAVAIDQTGKVTVNGQVQRGLITFGRDSDEFLLILANDPATFIDSISAEAKLPYDVSNFDTIQPRIYAIHGVEHSDMRFVDSRTVDFTAQAVPPGSEVSIGFSFPKNYFHLSPLGEFRSRLVVLSPDRWLLIGALFPGLTALMLLYLLLARTLAQFRVRNRMPLNLLPSNAPPALIGALYHGHIGKKEITATLFDLARRGFISVHLEEDDEIVFAKGASLYSTNANLLRPYEIFLLHQIFGDEGFATHSKKVTAGLNSELFSSKVALTILNIYDAVVAEGYFRRSPNNTFIRFKTLGLFSFFIALLALVYDAFTLPEPAFVLFLWVGMLLASLIIIRVIPGLPRRTRMGEKTLKQWLGFRNYLTAKGSVSAENTSDFFRNLPYAIVMDCEKEWIARWKEVPIRLPDWFTASEDLFTAEEFSKSVLTIIDFLAKHLIAARPPDLA